MIPKILRVSVLAVFLMLATGRIEAQAGKPASSDTKAAVKTTEATGQHRGFTNDHLFLRLDDGKETTFVVDIPGDKEEKWHKDFDILTRITVTYHEGAAGGQRWPHFLGQYLVSV